jgi:hypothetical protein
MAYAFPEGSKFQFSTTFAAAKTISAMTNANPTVCTSTAHGYADNDEILLTSGWEDATDTVWRADQLTADTFSLVGLDTTSTSFYAAGGGANSSAQRITGWTDIPQVLSIATSGGDARFTTISPLARRNAINVPTGFNPTTITLTLGHDPALAAYATMLNISRALSKVAFKMVISGGGTTYGFGYMSVSEAPSLNVNQANTVQAAITLLGRSISYAT